MKVKLLAALKTKFVGVDDAILDRIATKKAEGLTDESQITSIVDGISFADVLTSYGDYRAGDASNSAVRNYEKKHNLKDGKVIDQPSTEPNPQPKPDDMAAMIANAVSAAIKPFSEEIAGFKAKEFQAQRQTAIIAKAKECGIPESQAKRYAIPDDADLDVYFTEAKQDWDEAKQDLVNEGFDGTQPPESPEKVIEKEGTEFAKMINKGTEEFVEQNKK